MIEMFARLGIAVPPGSRLTALRDALNDDDVMRPEPGGDPTRLAVAREGLRDIRQLEYVADHIGDVGPRTLLMSKLQECVRDSALIPQATSASPGRDAQAELLVAATFVRAAFLRVRFDEPDLKFAWDGRDVGVAVKRAKSDKNLLTTVRDGANQIRGTGIPGLIYLDVSLAFNPTNAIETRKLSDDAFAREHEAAVQKRIAEGRLRQWIPKIAGKRVRGILVVDHRLRFIGSKHVALETQIVAVDTGGTDPRACVESSNLLKAVMKGLR